MKIWQTTETHPTSRKGQAALYVVSDASHFMVNHKVASQCREMECVLTFTAIITFVYTEFIRK